MIEVEGVFAQGGLLASSQPGYAPRPGQIAMAQAVATAIEQGRHLVVEGPTGTGKSLAYSVPAILDAVAGGSQVVVVTANIALQEQLVAKDLPLLQAVLPAPFSVGMLKGKQNYLCLERRSKLKTPQARYLVGSLTPDDRGALEALESWAAQTKTGDSSELSALPPPRVWSLLSVDAGDCLGKTCPFYDECFARRAQSEARLATIIVTNYHLLFAHIALADATGQDLLLPALETVVLDEAHEADDIARNFFGFQVSLGTVRKLAGELPGDSFRELRGALLDSGLDFFTALGKRMGSPQWSPRLRVPSLEMAVPLLECLDDTAAALRAAIKAGTGDLQLAARLFDRAVLIASRIRTALELQDPNLVVFLEGDLQRAALCTRCIDVSGPIRDGLFARARSVIVTSATLASAGSFDLVIDELGIPDPLRLVVRSPFDYSKQALLIVPDGLPQPNDPLWPSSVGLHTVEAVRRARGRTLGLFTSYRNMELARKSLEGCGFRVLVHGDAPRSTLIESFRADISSVLLGTDSFWAGVDVPGEACSCVIIDRLPFPRPDDPVLSAIAETDPQWFRRYGLPRAIIAFKQGFGRLIRGVSDRGVVVVLDPRILGRSYGWLFLKGLWGLRVSRSLDDLEPFLRKRQSGGGR